MDFETVIGLEVHVELKTDSKLFSPVPAHFCEIPNSNTHIVDWAFPGVLPVINERAIEYGIKAALALNMNINKTMHFDRKNYFYPDNPKAYQISQFRKPIGYKGWIEIELEDGTSKKIRVDRVHLEEDAGKSIHGIDGYSYIDLNRQGIPLIEIVSEADMRSPEDAYAYLTALKEIVQYTGISDVKMEEGSMRVDANVSIRYQNHKELGTKIELKNLNSFNFVRKGLTYEVERQKKVLRNGGQIKQATYRYDETTDQTVLMRMKEESSDYRYFPEPDLPILTIEDDWIENIQNGLPRFPRERRRQYIDDYDLTDYDARQLTIRKEISDFFEAAVQAGSDAKSASNWLQGDVAKYLNAERKSISEIGLTPENLTEMLHLVENGTISSKIAKKVFIYLAKNGGSALEYIRSANLMQISDPTQLLPIIHEILRNNESTVSDYKNGRKNAVQSLIGQLMKVTHGRANPKMSKRLLNEVLEKLLE